MRERQLKAIDAATGAWKDKDHTELKQGSAKYIAKLRRQDEKRFQFIRQLAPPPAELQAIREDAKRTGADQLTMTELDREVRTVRRQHDRKKSSKRGSK